jgi:hypothetical protein
MGPGVEQWVWVSDFYGFGFADLSPRIATTFLELSAKHYPERLGAFLVIGAPGIFSGLWSMLQPLVDPVSRKKIHMLPCAPFFPLFHAGHAMCAAVFPRYINRCDAHVSEV